LLKKKGDAVLKKKKSSENLETLVRNPEKECKISKVLFCLAGGMILFPAVYLFKHMEEMEGKRW